MIILADVLDLNEFLTSLKTRNVINCSRINANAVRYQIAVILNKINPIIEQYQKDKYLIIEKFKNEHKFIENDDGTVKEFSDGNIKVKDEYLNEYKSEIMIILQTDVTSAIGDIKIDFDKLMETYEIEIDEWSKIIKFV